MNLKILISIFCVTAVTACSAPQQARNYGNVPSASNASIAIPISRTPPQYPRHAAINRIEGSVTLSHQINQDGQPTNIHVLSAQPEGVFEGVAIRALEGWRFTPPDTPNQQTYRQIIDFTLGDPFEQLGKVHPEASLVPGSELDEDPVPLVRIQPAYPTAAFETGEEGYVTIEFTIGANGRPVDAIVTESSPPGVFDEAALHALQRWLFRPGIKAGYRVPVRVTQTLDFSLAASNDELAEPR